MEAVQSKRGRGGIKASSTAEYFAKNLQQVGFSSPTKAVLTTLKEAFDNSLDACEDNDILPTIKVEIDRRGKGSTKNTDQIFIAVEDNGPGIPVKDLPMVFGEYLASSKFGRGRCTRGQQGIGISAATTWAMQTAAQGVKVITKTKGQKKAVRCTIEIDLKNNKGLMKDREEIDWKPAHGTRVEFLIDGRVQINGEAGLLAFLKSNVLVNPHLELRYKLMDEAEVYVERVSDKVPEIPEATAPHPHTMKLGEFLAHSKLFGNIPIREWLRSSFSRVQPAYLESLSKDHGISKKILDQKINDVSEAEFKKLFEAIQTSDLPPPSTGSVLAIGEEGLARSILRLGEIDYFSVVSRKPAIADFKPVQVEVAVARLTSKLNGEDEEQTSEVIRFANRVPLQFDKASCAIVKAISTVNWKGYGLRQSRNALPQGPYIIAVSVVSPFIKFKNASKETIDASDELVEEIRRALMQAGQRLSRHLRKEHKEAALESKVQHIEQFAPILVEGLIRLTGSKPERLEAANRGLMRILGRETKEAENELAEADRKLEAHLQQKRKRLGAAFDLLMAREESDEPVESPPGAKTKLKKGVKDPKDKINAEQLQIKVKGKPKAALPGAGAIAKKKAKASDGAEVTAAAKDHFKGDKALGTKKKAGKTKPAVESPKASAAKGKKALETKKAVKPAKVAEAKGKKSAVADKVPAKARKAPLKAEKAKPAKAPAAKPTQAPAAKKAKAPAAKKAKTAKKKGR